jgi:urea transporter
VRNLRKLTMSPDPHSINMPLSSDQEPKIPMERESSSISPVQTATRSTASAERDARRESALGRACLSVLQGVAGVFFVPHTWVGALCLVLLLQNPLGTAAAGCALAGGFGMARLMGSPAALASLALNPLLVGLSLAFSLPHLAALPLLATVAGALTVLVQLGLAHLLRARQAPYTSALPVLSLPFMLATWAMQLPLPRGPQNALTHVATTNGPWGLTDWGIGYLQALGWVVFTPSWLAGAGLALALLAASRILFILSALGYATAVLTLAVLDTGLASPLYPYAFNGMLVAMAVGGAYLKPGRRSLGLALVAAVFSTVLAEALRLALQPLGLPAYSVAYVLVTVALLYTLRATASPLLPWVAGELPERMVGRYALQGAREGQAINIGMPLCGTWRISQGPAGPWTHQGKWQHACDFDAVDDTGRHFSGDGMALQDYVAFGKPVVSPVQGRVYAVMSQLPDEPPGTVSHANNWGNHVVIYDWRGFYVLLAHLAQGSVEVSVGQDVTPGMLLARVGNSGYSPEPHLHIQVQSAPGTDAAAVPFTLGGVTVAGRYQQQWLPRQGEQVCATQADPAVRWATSFKLDQVLDFQVSDVPDGPVRAMKLTVRMGLDGCFYLDSGAGQLWFSADPFRFQMLSVTGEDADLDALAAALPCLPFARGSEVGWHDAVPARAVFALISGKRVKGWVRRGMHDLLAWLFPHQAIAHYRARWVTQDSVEASLSLGTKETSSPHRHETLAVRIRFNELGIAAVQIGPRQFIRQASTLNVTY